MLQKGEQAHSGVPPLGRWLMLQITLKAKKTRTLWDILSWGLWWRCAQRWQWKRQLWNAGVRSSRFREIIGIEVGGDVFQIEAIGEVMYTKKKVQKDDSKEKERHSACGRHLSSIALPFTRITAIFSEWVSAPPAYFFLNTSVSQSTNSYSFYNILLLQSMK